MLKQDEIEDLNLLLSKNLSPECLGYKKEHYTCSRCIFGEECVEIKENKLDKYMRRGKEGSPQVPREAVKELEYKGFLMRIEALTKEFIDAGMTDEQIIKSIAQKGFKVSYPESFKTLTIERLRK